MRGLSDMKLKSLRLHVYGNGTMSNMKILISATRSRKTYRKWGSAFTRHTIEKEQLTGAKMRDGMVIAP